MGDPDDPDLWTIDHRTLLNLGEDNSAGNIAVVCNRCNRAKSSLPADLYLKLLDTVRKVYGEEVFQGILYHLSILGKAKKVETWSHRANYYHIFTVSKIGYSIALYTLVVVYEWVYWLL